MSERVALDDALEQHLVILLDTCVLIDELNEKADLVTRRIPFSQRAAPLVVFWEFITGPSGRSLSRKVMNERKAWLDNLGIRVLDFHRNTTRTFRSMLTTRAAQHLADALVAAECLARGLPLLTSNLRHFQHVTGLKLAIPREI